MSLPKNACDLLSALHEKLQPCRGYQPPLSIDLSGKKQAFISENLMDIDPNVSSHSNMPSPQPHHHQCVRVDIKSFMPFKIVSSKVLRFSGRSLIPWLPLSPVDQ
ncbi:hypothetical protein HPP92_028552, partial [Vanilla planifolia]